MECCVFELRGIIGQQTPRSSCAPILDQVKAAPRSQHNVSELLGRCLLADSQLGMLFCHSAVPSPVHGLGALENQLHPNVFGGR